MRAYQKGLLAERLCCWLLRLKGYRILAHREKTPLGEVDILARHGDTLVIIEVKYRQNLSSFDPIVRPSQVERLYRAGLYLSKKQPKKAFTPLNIRFDVMVLLPWRVPHHFKAALDLNSRSHLNH